MYSKGKPYVGLGAELQQVLPSRAINVAHLKRMTGHILAVAFHQTKWDLKAVVSECDMAVRNKNIGVGRFEATLRKLTWHIANMVGFVE